MSRSNFYAVPGLNVEDLLLDTQNPRIRHGADQADCIERLMRSKSTLLNLIEDIAKNGLTPEHILVSKTPEGKWRVRDGNRRVVSLKLLNRPSLALSNPEFAGKVEQIATQFRSNIPDKIDCLACDDEQKILDFLERKHTGENNGIGQKAWEAMLISLFKLEKNETDQHRRSAQLLLWAETHGLQINDDFPITTLTRGLTTETLALIGFKVENDELVPTLTATQAYALASRVINDLTSGRVNVRREGNEDGKISIYSGEERDKYFKKVRDEVGPPIQNPSSTNVQDGHSGAGVGTTGAGAQTDNSNQSNPPNQNPGATSGQSQGSPQAQQRPPSPTSLPQNRKCLFGPRKNASPGISIPSTETKAQSILVELRNLNPHETPLATTMLLRALIEISNNYYREKNGLGSDEKLHSSIASAADHMKTQGLLNTNQHSAVMSYTRGNVGMLHIKTLQQHIHKPTFHPNGQTLNTVWDEIGCFVRACWI